MSGLMVLAIGLGIGASMTMLTVLHVMDADPLPGRSAQLFRPYLNPLPRSYTNNGLGPDPSINLTWPDAMALLQAGKGAQQAAMAGTRALVMPGGNRRPFRAQGRMTTRGFFAMFGLHFVDGASWSSADGSSAAQVVVISQGLARRVFGSNQVVGRSLHLDSHDYRVVGVVRDWAPRPMFYVDDSAQRYKGADDYFVPLSTAVSLGLRVSGNQSGWGKDGIGPKSATMSWLQFWVQLDTPVQVAAYRRFLHNYAAQQKAAGRFERSPEKAARLYSLMGWLAARHIVPGDVSMQAGLAMAFLLVCLVNIVALLLAKFLRRAGEISVRRALGARRRDIFAQFCIESAAVGVLGGALGLLLAELGLWSVRQRPDDYAHLAQMDVGMLGLTIAAAVVASLCAGVLPAWRAARVAPALQLKAL
nr:ABC transporter permease [Oleiagrimonas sp. C23AA]